MKKVQNKSSGANRGFEATLWAAADKLRGHLGAAEYKHVVLGLIFLKYISDAFEELRARLITEQAEGANPEDPDKYRAENVSGCPRRPAGLTFGPTPKTINLWLQSRSRTCFAISAKEGATSLKSISER
jgi:hypothetical protein